MYFLAAVLDNIQLRSGKYFTDIGMNNLIIGANITIRIIMLLGLVIMLIAVALDMEEIMKTM